MDIQIGKGGNVDLAISRCADVALNFTGRSDYIYVESNGSANGILSFGKICRMRVKFKKGFYVRWSLRDACSYIVDKFRKFNAQFP